MKKILFVAFVNDSLGICFYHEIFAEEISNRSYPEQTNCIRIRTPFI